MSGITTHVLNTSSGQPAKGVKIQLEFMNSDGNFDILSDTCTNSDGRAPELMDKEKDFLEGTYRITFLTKDYFSGLDQNCFYPYASIVFDIEDTESHYHVPLLISNYSYSTYRGS
ncbi:hydroxyisourate hydrolase [bacterium]|nr:hydroxyisourate hydrolase [bacterium]